MDLSVSILVAVGWLLMLVGWLWLIVLGVKYEGVGKGILFFLVGLIALYWAARAYRSREHPDAIIPFFLMVGGFTLLILSVLIHSI
jgi:hypothetical protein